LNEELSGQNFIHVYNQEVDLDKLESGKFISNFIESFGGAQDLKLIHLTDISSVYKDGVLKFKMSNDAVMPTDLYPLMVDFKSEREYTWYGVSEKDKTKAIVKLVDHSKDMHLLMLEVVMSQLRKYLVIAQLR